MLAFVLIDVDDDYDLDNCCVDYKLYEGDVCKMLCFSNPLTVLPKKKDVSFREYWYSVGWNDCIDEIIGEKE